MRSNNRGQTLALFAVTSLLVALMVVLSLAIQTKIRDKIELQTLADASAYSTALVTARTYNSIAVLTRVQISDMVALTTAESLNSYAGLYMGSLYSFYMALSAVPGGSACPFYSRAETALQTEYTTIVSGPWSGLDANAGADAAAYQSNAPWTTGQQPIYARLLSTLNSGNLANALINKAVGGTPWAGAITASSTVNSVNLREVAGTTNNPRPASAIPNAFFAAMGSRGSAFDTGRVGGMAPLISRLQTVLANSGATWTVGITSYLGSGYYNDYGVYDTHSVTPGWPSQAFGDDDIQYTLNYSGTNAACIALNNQLNANPIIAHAHVRSTDLPSTSPDEHIWGNVPGTAPCPWGPAEQGGTAQQHTMGPCTSCPGIWPMFIDLDQFQVPNGNQSDVFGSNDVYIQPKNYAVLQRDYSAGPTDPWDLHFTFKFSSAGQKFDDRAQTLSSNGTDISKQTAMAAGIAYYHRMGHWKEPPNLLNPFWRATLVPVNVDAQGKWSDVTTALANAPFALNAFNALVVPGQFQGVQ